jgi:hypothetical protein
MVVRMAAVQLSSPDSMRGRISAVNSIFIGSSNELGGSSGRCGAPVRSRAGCSPGWIGLPGNGLYRGLAFPTP